MTPTEVLVSLRQLGGPDLASTISACGGFVSPPELMEVVDRQEVCRYLGGHWYCEPHGASEPIVWPGKPSHTPVMRRALFDHILWGQDSEETQCSACRGITDVRAVTINPNVPMAVRGTTLICQQCIHRLGWRERSPRVVMVGEVSPTPGGLAFLGPSGDRLRRMLDLDLQEFYQEVVPINVLPSSLAVRPSRLPRRAFARLHGMSIEPVVLDGRLPVIVFGEVAMSAMPLTVDTGLELHGFAEGRCGSQRLFKLPHPSGRCRYWNDPENRERLRLLFRSLIHGG